MRKQWNTWMLAGLLSCAFTASGNALELNAAKDLSPVTVLTAERHAPIVLAKRGGQAIPIVCVNSKQPKAAVTELANNIQLIAGVKPEILFGKEPEGPAIVIGGGIPGTENLPDGGFIVKTSGNKIYIAGKDRSGGGFEGSSEGTMYGIIDFMERILDVRWYFPTQNGGRYTAKKDEIVVPPLHYSDYPRFPKARAMAVSL